MLEAVDLSKRHANGTLALDALNLRVAGGEIYCLLGAPRSGKTTAVNLFLGFTAPTSGRALIDGIDVARDPHAARRRVAFLEGGMGLYERLTGRQHLELFSRLAGRGKLPRQELYRAMREVELPEQAFEKRLREWSPGMRMKLGVAAAWLKESPALVLDEPFSGLDPKAAAELAELLRRLRAEGRALLIAMHDLFWAQQLADQAGILLDGRQVLTRSRGELRGESLEKIYLDYMQGGARVAV